MSELAERLEDDKGYISELAECLRIINATQDRRVQAREIGRASGLLRAIFEQTDLTYNEVQALRAALRQVNVAIEV